MSNANHNYNHKNNEDRNIQNIGNDVGDDKKNNNDQNNNQNNPQNIITNNIDIGNLTKGQIEMLKSFDEYIINSAIAADPTGEQIDTSTLYPYFDQL